MINIIMNGYESEKDPELYAHADLVHSCMTEHAAIFPEPTPTMVAFRAIVDSFKDASIAAANRDRVAIAVCKAERTKVIKGLHSLGRYVNMIADGDKVIGLKSGLRVKEDPKPVAPITAAPTPKLTPGVNSAEIAARIKSVEGAENYIYHYTDDPTLPVDKWMYKTGKTKVVLQNLVPGVRYHVCVTAVGPRNQYVTGEASSLISQ